MFTKLKVTQSMIDAVNAVLNEKKMDEADLDETGLRKAAYAAHTAGQKMFTFKGKTYPVKIQGEDISYGEAVQEESNKDLDARNKEIKDAKQKIRGEIIAQKAAMKSKTQKEETEIDEAMSGEVTKTKTGLIHRSTKAYGGSKPEKNPLDKLKGPKTKELIKKDVEDEKKTRGRYDEELKGDQHKIDKNKNNKIDSQDFAILRGQKKVKEDMHFAKKLIEGIKRSDIPASVRKARGDAPLTPAEVKAPAKDSISDKENLAKARNEEVEQIDEKNVPTSPEKWAKAKAAAKSKFAVYPSAYANGWASKKYKAMGGGWKTAKEEVEVEEKILDEKAGYSAKAARAGKDIGKPGKAFSMIAKKAGERYGSGEAGKRVAGAILAKLRKEDEDWSDEDIDALFEVYDLEERKMTDSEMKKREDIVKGMKKGFAGFKARYGDRAKNVMYATANKQAMKEASEDSAAITTDTLAGRSEGGKSNDFKSYKIRVRPLDKEGEQEPKDATPPVIQPDDTPARKSHETKQTLKMEGKRPETDDAPPFDEPYTRSAPTDVKDKSGAVHTPMSRARDLARAAMKKVKTEMLGKTGTSESKK